MITISKRALFILVLLIALVIAVFWAAKFWSGSGASKYSAVYLTTGDMYFGEFNWLPTPHVKRPLHLERSVDAKGQQQMALVGIKNTFWTPIDVIYLNPKEIVFWTRIQEGSDLAKFFEKPEADNGGVPPAATGTQGAAPQDEETSGTSTP